MGGREQMVARQIRARGVRDERVLEAMTRVPREAFIPEELRGDAYEDRPVSIGFGQTISQPYIVGYMTEALQLEPGHRVLEIGTGCGYQTAILAELAAEVYSIEVIPELAARARATLARLGYANVHVRTGDGHQGWPEEAPFDRMLAAAAPSDVPSALVDQLATRGIIVIPLGSLDLGQDLHVMKKGVEGLVTLATMPVRFVPMITAPPAR